MNLVLAKPRAAINIIIHKTHGACLIGVLNVEMQKQALNALYACTFDNSQLYKTSTSWSAESTNSSQIRAFTSSLSQRIVYTYDCTQVQEQQETL